MKIFMPITFCVLVGCGRPAPDLAKEKQAILQIEKAQREYHFKKNAVAFSGVLSDSFLSVNRGIVSTPSKEETQVRFNKYFNSVEFIKWDDTAEPVIRFSNDGSAAWVTVQKKVIVKKVADDNTVISDTTHFAWVSIYKKGPDGWKIDCVASTNK